MSVSSKVPSYLLIKLIQIQRSASQQKQQQNPVYFSFSITDTMYFSSCIPYASTSTFKTELTDDILIPLNDRAEVLEMQRWDNHIIMFTYTLELAEMKTRGSIIKKIETQEGEYVKIMIIGLGSNEIRIGYKYVESITQHYLFIDRMELICNQTSKNDQGPSFFKIQTQNQTYMLPIIDAQMLIKLPSSLKFTRIKNGKQVGKSNQIETAQLLLQQTIVPLNSTGGYKYQSSIKLSMKWGINFQQPRPENVLLLDAQEIMIYDIDLKFQNSADFTNTKIKFVYGNKAFELGSDFNNVKSNKIKKIVNLFTKSEDQEIFVIVEKNLKVIAQGKILVEEITPFAVSTIKKKITDLNGKQIGLVKAKCERAKNLSTPTNNKIWRQSGKHKNSPSTTLLILDQLSIKCNEDHQFTLSFKTDAEQKFITDVPNLQYFNKNTEVTKTQVVVILKPDENVYIVAKDAQNEEVNKSDFVGIALFNPSECRLGQNCISVHFFKNQIRTLTLFCQAHKIPPYPFIKPIFQPQLLQNLPHKSMSLSIVMREMVLSPYFYTYRYDNKNELYCIVEVNRIKKVLIMQNRNKNNQLAFNCSASSDNLDFTLEESQHIKVKITFLVSDIGQEQEIYGSSFVKIKYADLEAASTGLKFYLIQIKNQFGNNLGQINFEVHKATLFNSHMQESRDVLESSKKMVEGEKRKVKMHLAQIGQSLQLKQKSVQLSQKKQLVQKTEVARKLELSHQNLTPNRYLKPPHVEVLDPKANLKKASARYEQIVTLQKRQRNNSVMGVEGSVKLPTIREQSASPKGKKKNLNELVQMMKVRKRSVKGTYQQNSMLSSYQLPNFQQRSNLKPNYKFDDSSEAQTFLLKQKIQKQNPNLPRNMQILFPKKSPRQAKNLPPRLPIRYQEQKLKGLKSVLNQISSDMGEIEPTVREDDRYQSQSKKTDRIHYEGGDGVEHLKGPEWEDNQFAV